MATPEELEALVEELKTQNEAMANKNKELLAEVKKERSKNKEIDMDAYHKTLDELESVKSENAKLQNEVKLKAKDLEKVTGDLQKKDAFLNKTILTDGLDKALLEAGVHQKALLGARNTIKDLAKIEQNGDDYFVTMSDKPMSEYVNEWVKSEQGSWATIVTPDQGAGARGGSQGGGDRVVSIKDAKTPEERRAAIEARIKQ